MPHYANGTSTHIHHIVPTHANGGIANNHPDNLIELTIEQHADAHKQLWLKNGDDNDQAAYLFLSGQITKAEAQRRAYLAATPKRIAALRDPNLRAMVNKKISQARKGKPLSEKHRAALKAAWERPDTRQKRVSAYVAMRNTPEYKQSSSLAQKKSWIRRRDPNSLTDNK